MERLTERMANGTVRRTDVMGESVMLRLAAYEDTGLTPGDIRDLQGICAKNGLAEYVDTIVKAKRLIAKDNERSMEQDERIEQLEAELDEYRQKIADGRLVEVSSEGEDA
jgi:predicted RNA-binding protein